MLHYNNASSNNDTVSYRPTATVVKAFSLLDFVGAHQPVKPAEISRETGLTRTNVHRLLATLQKIGYVTRDPLGQFRLSFKIFALGSKVVSSRDLREVAKPVMMELMNTVNENVYLNVLYDNRVVAIEEVKSRNPLSPKHDVTYSYPVHACASGKAFLASMDAEARSKTIDSLELVAASERTIVNKEELERDLDATAERGYAIEIGEFTADLNSYAAPVYDHREIMVATISISGPAIRATAEYFDQHVPDLKRAAEAVSRELGNKGLRKR